MFVLNNIFSHSCFLIIVDDEPKTKKNQSRVPYFDVFSTYTQFTDLWSEDAKYQCLFVLLEKSCKTYRWLIRLPRNLARTMGSPYMIFVDRSSEMKWFSPSFILGGLERVGRRGVRNWIATKRNRRKGWGESDECNKCVPHSQVPVK